MKAGDQVKFFDGARGTVRLAEADRTVVDIEDGTTREAEVSMRALGSYPALLLTRYRPGSIVFTQSGGCMSAGQYVETTKDGSIRIRVDGSIVTRKADEVHEDRCEANWCPGHKRGKDCGATHKCSSHTCSGHLNYNSTCPPQRGWR